MQIDEQEAINAIQRSLVSADSEEMIYRLYVVKNVRRGQQDVNHGITESTDVLLRDVKTWRRGSLTCSH